MIKVEAKPTQWQHAIIMLKQSNFNRQDFLHFYIKLIVILTLCLHF